MKKLTTTLLLLAVLCGTVACASGEAENDTTDSGVSAGNPAAGIIYTDADVEAAIAALEAAYESGDDAVILAAESALEAIEMAIAEQDAAPELNSPQEQNPTEEPETDSPAPAVTEADTVRVYTDEDIEALFAALQYAYEMGDQEAAAEAEAAIEEMERAMAEQDPAAGQDNSESEDGDDVIYYFPDDDDWEDWDDPFAEEEDDNPLLDTHWIYYEGDIEHEFQIKDSGMAYYSKRGDGDTVSCAMPWVDELIQPERSTDDLYRQCALLCPFNADSGGSWLCVADEVWYIYMLDGVVYWDRYDGDDGVQKDFISSVELVDKYGG